jgi:mono/diheme cytochrome c family protein
MKKVRHFSLFFAALIVLSLILAACGGGSPSSDAPSGDPAAGKAAFAALACHTCHGDNAQGNIGPKLAGLPLNYTEFQKIVRNGQEQMPAWSTDKVSDQQLQDLYAWFKGGAQ